MKKYGWAGAVFVLAILLAGVYVSGLPVYLQAVYRVYQLPQEKRDKAKHLLWDSVGVPGYSGIIAYIVRGGAGGVWIWGKAGLKYFAAGSGTTFGYYTTCDKASAERRAKGESAKPAFFVTGKAGEWGAKRGDYVYLYLGDRETGSDPAKIREARAHDWWAFLPSVSVEEGKCGR